MPVQTKGREITRKEIRGLFAKSFITQSRDVIWPEVCETIDTFSEKEFFATLGTVPQVTELGDDEEVEATDLREYTFDFKNRLFKSLVRLKRSLIDFDQTGQSRTILHSMAGRLANWPDELFIERLIAGDSNLCITGDPFFSLTHNLGGTGPADQPNILDGSTLPIEFSDGVLTRPELAEAIQTDLDLAMAQLLRWKDDHGKPFHQKIRPEDLVIVCSPLTFTTIKLALGAKFIAQTDNVFEGFVGRVLVSNYLESDSAVATAADWYLLYTGHVNRPFIYSRFRMRTDGEMQDNLRGMESTGSPFNITMEDLRNLSSVELLTNLGNRGGTNSDAHVILHEEFLMAGRFRGEVTYGIPWTAVKVDNTT